MTTLPKSTLQEELQKEYSSLDSSLIAAFLSEYENGKPTSQQLHELRHTLAELAAGADLDEQHIHESLSSFRIEGSSLNSSVIEGNSEVFFADSAITDTTSPSASLNSSSSVASFSSPLGFLQAAFPGVPSTRFTNAISEAGHGSSSADDVDIERVIQLLLTQEYLKDLEERGLDALEDEDVSRPQPQWRTVDYKTKKRKGKVKAVAVNDVRQQHHVSKIAPRHGPTSAIPPKFSEVDAWTAVSSLSAHLASLLPPHPESFFKSFFHSPESESPAAAARQALTSIFETNAVDGSSLDMIVLSSMQELIRSSVEYNELDAEDQDRFVSDTVLCLGAAKSRQDEALDLVWLLRSLDADLAGEWKMGPYHYKPLPRQERAPNPPGSTKDATYRPSTAHTKPLSGHPPGRPPPQPQNAWNAVPYRKAPAGANPHAAFIPAYNTANGARRSSVDRVGPVRARDAIKQRRRLDGLAAHREKAIMSAAKAWKGGNAKNRGGEVAMFYAEEARKLQEEMRKEALDSARIRVSSTVKSSSSLTTVDLHFTTVAEAVVLAKDFLKEYGATEACPLQFITGRGVHSVGGKGVLGPAVRASLIEDGWNVATFPAGLTIRGRLR
ncbi:hypothetical protein BC834DRAFT_361426 [Gloeopeniophorella convolvens]|nr:hypothetical protein BC834DRAFT_361426 [Gloeopeniophorella convolvens]